MESSLGPETGTEPSIPRHGGEQRPPHLPQPGHRRDPEFDKDRPGEPGFSGQDHYHQPNPDSTGKGDHYLDGQGQPVPKGSRPSHILPDR